MSQKIKTGGRTKGTPNKVTKELRQKFEMLVNDNFDKLQSDIDNLEPKERIKTIIELSKFILPTLRATDLQAQLGEIKPLQFEVINWIEKKNYSNEN